MRELQIDTGSTTEWFAIEQTANFSVIRIQAEHANLWASTLANAFRRCYVDDSTLESRAAELNKSRSEIVAAKLPDEGSTMAGDFGEVLVYLCHAALKHPLEAFGPKKWRLKQDRNKPAPYSDVVHFLLPDWPKPSDQDTILCSEVKTKSTPGGVPPVAEAMRDCEKDYTSRLANTLVWLRDRALGEDLGSVQLPHLERFINLIDYPPPRKHFYAVVVVCSSLLEQTLAVVPSEPPRGFTLLVIAVPNLRSTYSAVFQHAHHSVQPSNTTEDAL